MRKRTWMYVLKPQRYEISCDKCNGSNIEWSEFEGMIWCYDCKIDTRGDGGIFNGPIPLGASQLLGLSFDRINLKKKRVEYMRIVGHKVKWFAKPKVSDGRERESMKRK